MDQYMISVDGVKAELEKDGVTEVKRKLLANAFGEKKKPIVLDWLKEKEEAEEKILKQKQISLSADANEIARDANYKSDEANIIARHSSSISVKANKYSLIAILISIIAVMISVFKN